MSDLLHHLPSPDALPDYYQGYIGTIDAGEAVLDALEVQGQAVLRRFADLTSEEAGHRYAPEKWTVMQVLGHVIDTERVFQLRALWFARGDQQPLPGYAEGEWGSESNVGDLTPAALLDEYRTVRAASISLFKNLGEAQLARRGTASGKGFQVAALAWFLLGHERHHLRILQERYGV